MGICSRIDNSAAGSIGFGLGNLCVGAAFSNFGGAAPTPLSIFFAPLLSSTILTRGTGTASFTRATAASVTDFEGLIKTAKIGEARFTGARRVENFVLIPDFTNAYWLKIGCTVTGGVADPIGGTSAYTVTNNSGSQLYRAFATDSTKTYNATLWMRRRTGTGNVSLTWGSTGGFYNITAALTTNWQRISVPRSASASIEFNLLMATLNDAVDIWQPQLEDTTGQANQNPSEYVSVGAVTPYVGAEIAAPFDGTWVLGAGVSLAGSSLVASASSAYTYKSTSLPVQASSSYVVSFTVSNYSAGTANAYINSTPIFGGAVSGNGNYQQIITPLGTSQEHGFQLLGFTGTISNYSVKPSLYHGAMVDGVQYFTTQNGNSVAGNVVTEATGVAIPDATLKGFLTEPSATNLLLNSAVLVTQNVTTTATPYTLSIYGTGSVTLSGAATGTLVGTGANNRVSLTVTPTAGTLTITPTGSVTNSQLEATPYATSYIATTTATVTRSADKLTYPTAGNALNTAGSWYSEVSPQNTTPSSGTPAFGYNFIRDFGAAGLVNMLSLSTGSVYSYDGVTALSSPAWSPVTGGQRYKIADSWAAIKQNFLLGTAGTTAAFNAQTYGADMSIGNYGALVGTYSWNGNIRNISIWNTALRATYLQNLTASIAMLVFTVAGAANAVNYTTFF